MTLYELSNDYQEVLSMAEDEDIGYEAIQDTLEALEGEFEIKADAIACIIKTLQSENKAIKEEIDTLNKRIKSKTSKSYNLKEYLYQQMGAIGKNKIETARNVISIRKSPPKTEIDDINAFIDWAENGHDEYLTHKPPEPNKKAIREAIKNGEKIPNVTLESGESLSIK